MISLLHSNSFWFDCAKPICMVLFTSAAMAFSSAFAFLTSFARMRGIARKQFSTFGMSK